MTPPKLLVTGSLGHIGSRVLPMVADRYTLVPTDIREGEVAGHTVTPLDITDYEAVLAATRGVDAILHLAIVSVLTMVSDKPRFDADEGPEYLAFNEAAIETHLRGTYHLFEAARQNGVPRFVYGSSLTVLIGHPAYEAVHDGLPPRPSNFYGVTKLWGEQLGEYFSRRHGIRVYCLRFGTPHPQREAPEYERWMRIPAGTRTFVTYADLAGSMMAALCADGPPFGSYTVVSDAPGCIYDTSKAAEINWQPQDFIHEDGSVTPGGARASRK